MTGIDSYSITPATNATADGGAINYAEGMPPSAVNNTGRQALADERTAFNDLIWFQYGTGDQGAGNIAVPSVYASSTSFTITGADVTLVYHSGRRVRAVGSGTGTIYGTISSSSYNSGATRTTVNVTWDSGSLTNETLVISLSQIPITGSPVSGGASTAYVTAAIAANGVGVKTIAGVNITNGGAAVQILPGSEGVVRVRYDFGGGNVFAEIVNYFQFTPPTVFGSVAGGSPGTRVYDASGGNLTLAISGAPGNITAANLSIVQIV